MPAPTEIREQLVTQRAEKKQRYDECMAKGNELLAASGGEAINTDKRAEFDGFHSEALQLRKEIEALEMRIDSIPQRESKETMEVLKAGGSQPGLSAFRRFVMDKAGMGGGGLSAEERSACLSGDSFRTDVLLKDIVTRAAARIEVAEGMKLMSKEAADAERAKLLVEADRYGAFTTPSDGSGVPTTTLPAVQKRLQSIKGVRPKCTVMSTPAGQPLDFTTYSDIDRVAEELAEDASAVSSTDSGEDTGTISLGAFALSSKLFEVGRLLIMNAAFDVESFVRGQLMRSIAQRENSLFSGGDGANKPQGYRGLAATGETTASATAFTFNELVNLIYSVDIAYRYAEGEGPEGLNNFYGGAGACWVMHDSVIGYIRQLQDGENRYLWERGPNGYQMGAPDMLLGFPIQIDQHAPALTGGTPDADAAHVVFGDLSYHVIRDSGPGHFDVIVDYQRVGRDNVGFNQIVYVDSDTVSPRVSGKVECYKQLMQQ